MLTTALNSLVMTTVGLASDGAFAVQLYGDDSNTLGLFAFFYAIFHGENIIMALKALAPEGKAILGAIGAGCAGLAALFARR